MTPKPSPFATVFGSDVDRDGVFLELSRRTDHGTEVLLEAFRSDRDRSVTITAYGDFELPLSVIEQFLHDVRVRLVNGSQAGSSAPPA